MLFLLQIGQIAAKLSPINNDLGFITPWAYPAGL